MRRPRRVRLRSRPCRSGSVCACPAGSPADREDGTRIGAGRWSWRTPRTWRVHPALPGRSAAGHRLICPACSWQASAPYETPPPNPSHCLTINVSNKAASVIRRRRRTSGCPLGEVYRYPEVSCSGSPSHRGPGDPGRRPRPSRKSNPGCPASICGQAAVDLTGAGQHHAGWRAYQASADVGVQNWVQTSLQPGDHAQRRSKRGSLEKYVRWLLNEGSRGGQWKRSPVTSNVPARSKEVFFGEINVFPPSLLAVLPRLDGCPAGWGEAARPGNLADRSGTERPGGGNRSVCLLMLHGPAAQPAGRSEQRLPLKPEAAPPSRWSAPEECATPARCLC